jgi:hypothetical protein
MRYTVYDTQSKDEIRTNNTDKAITLGVLRWLRQTRHATWSAC